MRGVPEPTEGNIDMNLHAKGDEVEARTLAIVANCASLEGPLLPILHALQAEFGYIPEEALPVLARELNLSRAEVHGVVTFYHDFRAHPAGKHVLKICRAEACQSMGGRALEAAARSLLGIGFHETTADGMITLEPVYCLGLCATAPAAMLDNQIHGRLDADELATIVAEARQ